MDLENINNYSLRNLNKINIVLGKNGCGKSLFLRSMEAGLSSLKDRYGKIKYITPERGGGIQYEAGIEQNMTNNPQWMIDVRRKNQTNNFRQQSVTQYRILETLVLREIEKTRRADTEYTFDTVVKKINALLDNIQIKREGVAFEIYGKDGKEKMKADIISSGESELISLAIECLVFDKECISGKENILFLDEPDVHLHPDLQYRLMSLLRDLVESNNFKVVIATHSTAILGSLESYKHASIVFMGMNQKDLELNEISSAYRKILPIFGAHPLSNLFNEAPVVLLEGEDDERIWQQVVRTSSGTCKLYPCSCDGIANIDVFEREVSNIINAVYDDAKAYSIRDRDAGTEAIDDAPPVVRMKLSCRNAENLLLTDEVLGSLSITWDNLRNRIDEWLKNNSSHVHYKVMRSFKDNDYNRKDINIKDIRNDFMGIIGSSKPWEVAVGQVIGQLKWGDSTDFSTEGSIYNFLGEKLVKSIIPQEKPM